ncbi:MAG: DUF3422 family protein [Proteobacteria bacterium]|nr:DUF3422 family protein [Pseudomonadota bacterium]
MNEKMNYSPAEYAAVMREPHTRSSRPVGAPALIWHLGFWATDMSRKGLDDFERAFEPLIDALYTILEHDSRFKGERARYKYLPLAFNYGGASMAVIFSRYYEYATLTTILDLSYPPDEDVYSYPHADARADVAAVGMALRRLQAEAPDGDPAQTSQLHEPLFHSFWTAFAGKIGLGAPIFGKHAAAEIFADFRGLVVSSGEEGVINKVDRSRPRVSFPRDIPIFSAQSSQRVVEQLAPLVGPQALHPEDVEFIACNMITDRAVFISTLGNAGGQVPRPGGRSFQDWAPEPLTYIVAANGAELKGSPGRLSFDRWQVGRLVFRLNELGTNRCMALRDSREIKKAGQVIFDLGQELDSLFERLTEGTTSPATLRQSISLFFELLNTLGKSIPSGGLSYRINRSRQFFSLVKQSIEGLRISRIEGVLPYDEFLKKRLFGVLEEFDRLGIRTEALYNRANTLLSLVDAEVELASLDNQIKNELTQTNTLTSIESLQRAADVLVPLAGTYYLGMTLSELFDGGVALAGHASWLPITLTRLSEPEKDIARIVAFAAAFVAVLLLQGRFKRAHRKVLAQD